MVQATDDDAMTADNVRPIRPDVTPEPQPRRERPKDHRAAARKAKSRSKNKADRDTGLVKTAPSSPHIDAPPIAPTGTPTVRNGGALRAAPPLTPNADARAPAQRHGPASGSPR